MTNWSHSSTNQLEAESERIAAELERRRNIEAQARARVLKQSLSHQVQGLQTDMQNVLNILSSMRR